MAAKGRSELLSSTELEGNNPAKGEHRDMSPSKNPSPSRAFQIMEEIKMFLHGWSMYRAGESGSVSRRSLQPMGMHKDRQGHAGGHQNCQELGTGQKKAPFGTAFPLLGRG